MQMSSISSLIMKDLLIGMFVKFKTFSILTVSLLQNV